MSCVLNCSQTVARLATAVALIKKAFSFSVSALSTAVYAAQLIQKSMALLAKYFFTSSNFKIRRRGRLGRNYILSGPLSNYKDLIGAAINVVKPGSATPPVLPTFVLVGVGLVNDFISLFTGKTPDLSLEIAIITS